MPSGAEHHRGDEQQAEIELPTSVTSLSITWSQVTSIAPMTGPMKLPTPPIKAREQHNAGLPGADRRRIGQLEIDRGEPAGDAGEEAGKREGDKAHGLRVVADELRPLGFSRTALHMRPNGVRPSAYIATSRKRHQAAIR